MKKSFTTFGLVLFGAAIAWAEVPVLPGTQPPPRPATDSRAPVTLCSEPGAIAMVLAGDVNMVLTELSEKGAINYSGDPNQKLGQLLKASGVKGQLEVVQIVGQVIMKLQSDSTLRSGLKCRIKPLNSTQQLALINFLMGQKSWDQTSIFELIDGLSTILQMNP